MLSKCIQNGNLLFLGQAPFVTMRVFVFCFFFSRADTPLADLLPLLTFSSKRDWIYNQCGTVCKVYSGHIEQVLRDLDWLLKVKALSTTFFLRISHPCPPDTWHYDTAASFQELPCLSLCSKLLHNSLVSFHIYTLSSCSLSLSCCYPSLSRNVQHIPEVVGAISRLVFSLFCPRKGISFSFVEYISGSI